MKLCGEFVVRRVVDEIVAVPVGETALRFNGMILLNDVSKMIWDCLSQTTDEVKITAALTQHFDVPEAEAKADVTEFLDKLRQLQLLEE